MSSLEKCLFKSSAYFFHWIVCFDAIRHHAAAAAKSLQSCLTLCDHIDGSPLGSSVPGILQAMEWVAISLSKPNQCVKKQRHHFSDKGPYSQSYAFFQ